MHDKLLRLTAFALVAIALLPILAGCGKSEKAMQTPDGLSNRDKRDKAQGLPAGT